MITTGHGRGNTTRHWSGHGFFINGSSQTWLAMIGPNIQPLGEKSERQQVYAKQLAETIANLAGEDFSGEHVFESLSKK